jgi:hypothetical protein
MVSRAYSVGTRGIGSLESAFWSRFMGKLSHVLAPVNADDAARAMRRIGTEPRLIPIRHLDTCAVAGLLSSLWNQQLESMSGSRL